MLSERQDQGAVGSQSLQMVDAVSTQPRVLNARDLHKKSEKTPRAKRRAKATWACTAWDARCVDVHAWTGAINSICLASASCMEVNSRPALLCRRHTALDNSFLYGFSLLKLASKKSK